MSDPCEIESKRDMLKCGVRCAGAAFMMLWMEHAVQFACHLNMSQTSGHTAAF